MRTRESAQTARRTKRSFTAWIAAVAGTVALVAASFAFAAPAANATHLPGDDVCSALDSGKINVSGDHDSIVVNAPAGHLITGYCVKAGSQHQDLGPKYVTVDPAQGQVTIRYFYDQKYRDISHYSLSYTHITYTGEATVGDSGTYCDDGQTVTVSWTSGLVTRTSTESQEAADAAALTEANRLAALDKASRTEGMTEGECGVTPPEYCPDGVTPLPADGICSVTPPPPPPPTTYTQSASVSGSIDLCLADKTTNLVVNYSGSGTGTSGISNEDATFIANNNANAAAAADRDRQVPAGATTGACGPVQVTAVEPATVAVPEAATVPETPVTVSAPEPATGAAPEPATVSVPMKATVPTAVHAGGGAEGDRGPSTGLLILALVAAGVSLLATGRLVATRTR